MSDKFAPVFSKKSSVVFNDRATGSACRRARLETGMSLRTMAKKMGISPPYLSDLERGQRHWRQELVDLVQSVL